MNRRTAFLLGILFQAVAIFGLFLPYVLLIKQGTTITLQTLPIDPRSIFRGDYVMLDYVAAQGLPENWNQNQVFIVLEPKGEVYERVSFSAVKPDLAPGQVCLQGNNGYMRAYIPSLSQYFVEEGLGVELQNAVNAHRLLVSAAVDDDCDSVIRYVTVGPEVPQSELEQWQRDQGILPPEAMPPRPMPVQ